MRKQLDAVPGDRELERLKVCYQRIETVLHGLTDRNKLLVLSAALANALKHSGSTTARHSKGSILLDERVVRRLRRL